MHEIWNSAAIQTVKLLTSNKSLRETFFMKFLDVPDRIEFYDLVAALHKGCKLNFITLIHEGPVNNRIRNIYIACRNSNEAWSFKKKQSALKIKGYFIQIEKSNKPLELNMVRIGSNLQDDVSELPRLMSFNASSSYSTSIRKGSGNII